MSGCAFNSPARPVHWSENATNNARELMRTVLIRISPTKIAVAGPKMLRKKLLEAFSYIRSQAEM